jgi:hypothetical protein
MKRLSLPAVLLVVMAFCAATQAGAAPEQRTGRTLLGVRGPIQRFDGLTGQRTRVGHLFIEWGQDRGWSDYFDKLFADMGEMPMLGLTTGEKPGTISPGQIASGAGDDFLLKLNAAVAKFGRPIYIRPFGEMNGHWNAYCAYTKSGASKGPAYSTAAFRKAFARLYLILHGGPLAGVNARLARLGLPPVRTNADLADNPYPTLRVIWNPQGYGSPDLPGNSAQAYYPGDRYVDVVGDDLYFIRGKAEWAAAQRLYDAHPGKPFAFPEWGLWGIDGPSFVKQMADFVRTHKRVEMIAYYNGRPGSLFDIASKPATRAAYRQLIAPLG